MAAPSTVHETSFETGTDSWFGRGATQLAVTTTEARTGTQSLYATGRTASWHGPALHAKALMPADAAGAGPRVGPAGR